jgi:hypothetical protein
MRGVRPKRIQHAKCATNDALRQRTDPELICVYQRASAAKFLFNPGLPRSIAVLVERDRLPRLDPPEFKPSRSP